MSVIPEKSTCIKVCARFRPTNSREKEEKAETVVNFDNSNRAVNLKLENDSHDFTFDAVFPPESTQLGVFEETGKKLVPQLLNGYNCTVFAYGQTGSGKTFTMEGELGTESRGVIPRIMELLFEEIEKTPEEQEVFVHVSNVEIYLEIVSDLLNPTAQNLRIRESSTGVYIQNVSQREVSCVEDVMDVINCGKKNRTVSATKMNSESSRSHAVFMVHVLQTNKETGSKMSGKLLLVDLAGSEKIRKSGAAGQQLEEVKAINSSLSELGNVIKALSEKASFVPYRNSKLTRLLSDSLGGNSKTVLILTGSPSSFNAEETLSTMRFGRRAKTIKNKPHINVDLSVKEYKAILKKLQAKSERQGKLIVALKGDITKSQPTSSASLAPPSPRETTRNLVEDLETKIDGLEKTNTSLQDKSMELEDAISTLKSEISIKVDSLKEEQSQKQIFGEKIAELSESKSAMISELKQFNEGLAKEKGDLRQELEQQNKKISEARDFEEKVSELVNDLEGKTTKLLNSECAKSEEIARLRALSDGLEQKNAELAEENTAKEQEHKKKTVAVTTQLHKLSEELAELREVYEKLSETAENSVSEAQKSLQSQVEKNAKLEADLLKKEKEIESLDCRLKVCVRVQKGEQESMAETISKLEQHGSDSAKAIEKLEKDIEAIKNESESLKESIERAEEERTTMEERHTVECDMLKKKILLLEEEKKSLEVTVEQLEEKSKENDNSEDQEAIIAELSSQLKKVQMTLSKARNIKKKSAEKVHELSTALHDTQMRYEQMERAMENETTKRSAVMKKKDTKIEELQAKVQKLQSDSYKAAPVSLPPASNSKRLRSLEVENEHLKSLLSSGASGKTEESTGIAIKAQIKDLSVFMRQRNPSLHHSGCSASEVEWNVQIIERILEWIKQQGKIPFVLGDIFPGNKSSRLLEYLKQYGSEQVPVDTLRAVILTVKFLIYNENRSAKPSRRHLNGMIVLLEELKRTYKSYERKSTSKSVRGRLLSAKDMEVATRNGSLSSPICG